MKLTPCPCGRTTGKGQALSLDTCCGPYHANQNAPDAESLMRSRYSAYVIGLLDYLLATWHASSSPGDLELPPVKWLGLEVRHAQTAGDAGVVEFVARCKEGGRAQRMHETSRFVREDDRWYYIDGQMTESE